MSSYDLLDKRLPRGKVHPPESAAVLHSQLQRRSQAGVTRVHICAVRGEQADKSCQGRSMMQSRPPAVVSAIGVCSLVQKDLRDFIELQTARHMERRLVRLAVGLVYVRTTIEEDFQASEVTEHHCQVDRCVSKPVCFIEGIWPLDYGFVNIRLALVSYGVVDDRRLAMRRWFGFNHPGDIGLKCCWQLGPENAILNDPVEDTSMKRIRTIIQCEIGRVTD